MSAMSDQPRKSPVRTALKLAAAALGIYLLYIGYFLYKGGVFGG